MDYLYNLNFTNDDIICSNKYRDFCNKMGYTYIKNDTMMTFKEDIIDGNSYPQNGKYLSTKLVMGHSDFHNSDLDILNMQEFQPHIKEFYGINNISTLPCVSHLPLGLSNPTNGCQYYPLNGNNSLLLQTIKDTNSIDKDYLLYMNFDHTTYCQERVPVFRYFGNKPWVSIGKYEPTEKGRLDYLHQARKSCFVLCPRGSGIDTHRLWESLYLGSIPVVRLNEDECHIYDSVGDLPILIINDWRKTTPEFLTQKYQEIISQMWNLDKLRVSYWLDHIQGDK